MGQLLSSLSLAISLRVPLALSFLLPWTVSPSRPSIDTTSSSSKAESSGSEIGSEGSSSSSGSSGSAKEKEGRNGSGSKRKASVSAGTTPSKRQHMPRRRASILIHTATMDDDATTTTELSSSSSASSDCEGPEPASISTPASKLAPLPPPVARARPIPNSYWATPLLLACEYPWCPRTASAAGHERPPKLDALLKAGVRCFVDLTEPGELSPYHVDAAAAVASKKSGGTSTPTTTKESKQTASVLLQRCAALGIPAGDVSYHRFPIQDRSLPPIISASSSTSSTSSSSSAASPSSPTTSSKCPLISRALALLSANAAEGKITAVHCRGGIGRTGVVVGCFLVHSGYVPSTSTTPTSAGVDSSESGDGDEAGENALRLIEREWKGVAKCTRYPQSPETGPQVEYVRHYRREVPSLGGVGAKMKGSGAGTGTGKATSVAVQFANTAENATRMITTTTITTTTSAEV